MQEAAKEIKVKVLIFTTHAHCFRLNQILLTVKIPDFRAFLKIISRHNF